MAFKPERGALMLIKVNGVTLYYEKAGRGRPFILLHGNGESHVIFDVLIEQLSPQYTVYAIDSRDHGKSSKAKNLDYRDMMEDIAAFIRELAMDPPIVFGFSDGGIVGLLLAIHYPELMAKLIISGANTHPDGMKKFTTLMMKVTYFFTRSRKYRLMLTQPHISDSELHTIVTPTLVLAGSKDMVRDEHTKSIAENIPGSVLRILDGESHSSYVIHSTKLYGIQEPFLAEG